MAKIYCHINQRNTSVQYFAILHAGTKAYETEHTFTRTFIGKHECNSMMQQSLRPLPTVARLIPLPCDRIIV